MQNGKKEIILVAIRRFPQLPLRTIAHFVLNSYGDLFDNDLERIRSSIRYYVGENGEKNRVKSKEYEEFRKARSVRMPVTWRKKQTPYKLPPGVWLILSDIHVPFHEPKPIESAIEEGHAEKVDGIFLNGDIQDCASVSFWPTARRDFNREVEAVVDFFDWIRQEFPKQMIVYKPGNHEYRLPRYLLSKAPELAETPLDSFDAVLGLEKRKIEFLDYYQLVMAGKLPILHGHELQHLSRTVNPARGLFLRTKTFSACSHCHTTSQHNEKNIQDELLTTWSFGCLCDLHPDYNPFGNWNWGFAVISVSKNGDFEVINRRILPNGKVV